jgi:hypothetical protein
LAFRAAPSSPTAASLSIHGGHHKPRFWDEDKFGAQRARGAGAARVPERYIHNGLIRNAFREGTLVK